MMNHMNLLFPPIAVAKNYEQKSTEMSNLEVEERKVMERMFLHKKQKQGGKHL